MATLKPYIFADAEVADLTVELLFDFPALCPSPSQLEWNPRAWLAGLIACGLAYEAKDCAEYLANWFGAGFRPFEAHNATGFTAQNPDRQLTLVAIAGSNDGDDWIQNLDTGFTRWRNLPGKITNGVADHADSVLEAIGRDHLDRKLLLVGHSLGGIVAQVLAAYFAKRGREVGVIAAGSPRTGDRQAARAIAELVPSAVHLWAVGDLVPHAPAYCFGYRHAPISTQYLARDGSLYRTRSALFHDYATAWLKSCRLASPCLLTRARRTHRLATYIARLRKFLTPLDSELTK